MTCKTPSSMEEGTGRRGTDILGGGPQQLSPERPTSLVPQAGLVRGRKPQTLVAEGVAVGGAAKARRSPQGGGHSRSHPLQPPRPAHACGSALNLSHEFEGLCFQQLAWNAKFRLARSRALKPSRMEFDGGLYLSSPFTGMNHRTNDLARPNALAGFWVEANCGAPTKPGGIQAKP